MRRKVTIEDIAQRANASITTVSMVLRDKPGIGAETRQRVLRIAREMGYQRRTPQSGKTELRNVAMILRARTDSRHAQLPSVNPFYSEVIGGIETSAKAERMALIYATLPVDQANHPLEMPEHVFDQPLAGILLVGSFSDETIAAVADVRSTPTVLVDAPAQRSIHDAIVSDNEGGAFDAVCHLVEQGHQHIALVGPDMDANPNFRQRRQGYLRALETHGLSPIFITAIDRAGMYAVADATGAMLDRHPEITAMFSANDAFAIEAIQGARAIGRTIPDNLSVVGFDDIALASQLTPRLTTMTVDRVTMGRLAVQTLCHRLAWPGSCQLMTVLQPALRIRDSVQAAHPLADSVTPDST